MWSAVFIYMRDIFEDTLEDKFWDFFAVHPWLFTYLLMAMVTGMTVIVCKIGARDGV